MRRGRMAALVGMLGLTTVACGHDAANTPTGPTPIDRLSSAA